MAAPEQPAEALVVDASVAVKWHLTDEEHAAEAADLLRRFGQDLVELFAPGQIRCEVPSALTVATRGRNPRLSAGEGRAAIEEFLALDITTVDDDQLVFAAYELAQQYGCALYDGLYLALARRLNVPFITADRRLYQRIAHLPDVIWITRYARRQL